MSSALEQKVELLEKQLALLIKQSAGPVLQTLWDEVRADAKRRLRGATSQKERQSILDELSGHRLNPVNIAVESCQAA